MALPLSNKMENGAQTLYYFAWFLTIGDKSLFDGLRDVFGFTDICIKVAPVRSLSVGESLLLSRNKVIYLQRDVRAQLHPVATH